MRSINKIVIHHSISPRDQTLAKSIGSFNRTHKARLHPETNSLGYHIAYHYVIAGDGSYKQTRADKEIGYHASDYTVNQESIGICFTGNFDNENPTVAQYKSAIEIISKYPGLSIHGHNEYASKSCPGKNLDLNILKIMLFYEKLRTDNYSVIEKDKRMFKDPAAFLDRIKDLPQDDKFSEMTYLLAILAEKLGQR